jgi:hypothetical protein
VVKNEWARWIVVAGGKVVGRYTLREAARRHKRLVCSNNPILSTRHERAEVFDLGPFADTFNWGHI